MPASRRPSVDQQRILKWCVPALLVSFLSLPVAAEPEEMPLSPATHSVIGIGDVNRDGWPDWRLEGNKEVWALTPGALLQQLGKTHGPDWLIEEQSRFVPSSGVRAETARLLWEAGRHEESLDYWDLARSSGDPDLLLELAYHYHQQNQWGSAFSAVAQAGSRYFNLYAQYLREDTFLNRVLTPAWKAAAEGPVLETEGAKIVLGPPNPSAETQRTLEIDGRKVLWDPMLGVVTIPDIGLQMSTEPKEMAGQLVTEMASFNGTTELLGESVEGRPIEAHWLGRGPEVVVFFGAFHGDEPESTDVCRDLLKHLRENPEFLEGRTAVIVPVVNPDGLNAGTRLNANSVDLNRNFPTSNWNSEGKGGDYWGGTAAVSEPETKIVVELLERCQPARIISIHCPYKCVNYDGPAERLAEMMAEENGYEVKPSIGYPTPGSFGTYAGIEGKIPTITLELPPTGEEDVWRDNREALLRALRGE